MHRHVHPQPDGCPGRESEARRRGHRGRLRGLPLAAALAGLLLLGGALAQAANPTVQVRYDAGLGYLLTSQAGMTLYVFGKDTPGTSTCYDACAENWPPLLADEAFAAPLAVPGAFSVIDRNDGGKQVAYNGMPLYTWAHDANPGDAAGQGVGNVWWVANLQPALQLLATANGNLVVGPTGMALYTYDKDAAGSSNCAGGCAKNWPPAVGGFAPADGHGVTVADGVKGTVDLIPRADSKGMQLTLNGAPLYYWIHDTAPGQTSGDGVGGVWHRAVQ